MKKIFTIKNIISGIVIILLDVCIYFFLGIAMMDYDDFYEESKGEYMSLESMDSIQRSIFFSLNIWNFINIILVVYMIYRMYKCLNTNKQINS